MFQFLSSSFLQCSLNLLCSTIFYFKILANVQKEDHPSKLDMNLANTKAWRPFFSNSYPFPGLVSVQVRAFIKFLKFSKSLACRSI